MNIGIYIYDNAEVLDFSGPFEVFNTTKRVAANDWNLFFIAETEATIGARGNFLVTPHYSINNHPQLDLLIIAGGIHTQELKKANVIQWIATVADSTPQINSVYTWFPN